VGAALLASAEGYTPRANQLLDAAREKLGTIEEIAGALAENLPQPKLQPSRKRRRKRKRKTTGTQEAAAATVTADGSQDGSAKPPAKKRRRRRRRPAAAAADGPVLEGVTTDPPAETV
jgi:hypothetical protein